MIYLKAALPPPGGGGGLAVVDVERAPGIDALRDPVEGRCPQCNEPALARYEVLSEGGWFKVVKCGECLHSVSREPWHALGHVHREGVVRQPMTVIPAEGGVL